MKLKLFQLILATATFAALAAQDKSAAGVRSTFGEKAQYGETRLRATMDKNPALGDSNLQIEVIDEPKPWHIKPRSRTMALWTSNVLLTDSSPRSDTTFIQGQGVEVGYSPTEDLSLTACYDFLLYRYDRTPLLDTDLHMANFNAFYSLPCGFGLSGGIKGQWANAAHGDTETYREMSPYIGVQNQQPLMDGKLILFAGYEFDQKFTNPVYLDRAEHSAYVGVQANWARNFNTSVSLSHTYKDYSFTGPWQPNQTEEHLSSITAQASWTPTSWLSLAAFAAGNNNNAINSPRDYKSVDVGGEVRAFWVF